MDTDRSDRAAGLTDAKRDRSLLAAAAIVAAAPLWCAKYLPFTDLPEHVAAIATLRHWADPAWATADTYTLAIGRSQYLAYHAIGALLAVPLGSAELANRVLLTLVAIALPYALRALLVAVRGDPRLAIFACPLFWSRPLVIGFLPYVASVPVLLYALARAVRAGPRRVRDDVALAALALLVFYLHLSTYTVLVLVVLAFEVLARTPLRSLPRRLAWLVPSFVAAIAWALAADPDAGPGLLGSDGSVTYAAKSSLGALFAAWSHDIWVGHVDEYAGVAFWVLVLWLGAQRKAEEPEGARGVALRLAPFLCVLVLFVALPFKVGAGAMLNVRLALPLALFVLLVPRPDPGRSARTATLLAGALTVVVAANAVREIRGTQRELGDLDGVLANIRPGARVLALHFERASSYTHSAAWVHALAYHRSRRGGVASVSFSEMRHWPIQYRPDARPPKKKSMFWDFEPCLFRNSVDGVYYDFVVSRGDTQPFSNDPPGPEFRRVADVDRWHVFEKVPGTMRETGVDIGPCAP